MQHIDQALAAVREEAGQSRDIADWELCKGICASLEKYRPLEPNPVPLLLQQHSVVSLIDAMPKDEFLGKALGEYRDHITTFEALNSRRLEILVSTKFKLDAMRARAERPEMIDHTLQPLLFVLRGGWRVDIPENLLHVRLWSQRMTRRYDLLPREWREL